MMSENNVHFKAGESSVYVLVVKNTFISSRGLRILEAFSEVTSVCTQVLCWSRYVRYKL